MQLLDEGRLGAQSLPVSFKSFLQPWFFINVRHGKISASTSPRSSSADGTVDGVGLKTPSGGSSPSEVLEMETGRLGTWRLRRDRDEDRLTAFIRRVLAHRELVYPSTFVSRGLADVHVAPARVFQVAAAAYVRRLVGAWARRPARTRCRRPQLV